MAMHCTSPIASVGATAQWFVYLPAYPQPMEQDRQELTSPAQLNYRTVID